MNEHKIYPAKLMDTMPTDIELSAATKRLYEKWPEIDDRKNTLFTHFKYSHINGIGKEQGTSRRDPSKIIKVNGLYYVYYTRRKTEACPVGIHVVNKSDEVPTFDWDLCDIYYATSRDGFNWEEQGIAVGRAMKGEYGDRSVSTPDILVWKGKYYLYFQAFTGYFSKKTHDYCGVSLAVADSPRGPFVKLNKPIVKQGESGDWDSKAIHDPYPLIYKGKVWMFYKGENLGEDGIENSLVRAQGLAIADKPEGPYVKHKWNPILNSGHETFLFPFQEGIAAVLAFDGVEKNTIQYAKDGIDFKVMSKVHIPPIAAGVYSPDAFTDSGDADGVTWGLSHIECGSLDGDMWTYMIRFDCDLDRRIKRSLFQEQWDMVGRYPEATYLRDNMRLPEEMKQQLIEEAMNGKN